MGVKVLLPARIQRKGVILGTQSDDTAVPQGDQAIQEVLGLLDQQYGHECAIIDCRTLGPYTTAHVQYPFETGKAPAIVRVANGRATLRAKGGLYSMHVGGWAYLSHSLNCSWEIFDEETDQGLLVIFSNLIVPR